MKILYICSTLERCGPTNQLLNIVTNLDDSIDVNIVTLSSEPSDSMLSSFSGFNVICLSKLSFFGKCFWFIKNRRSYSLFHSQGIRGDFFSSLFLKNNVSTLRNYPYDDYTSLYGSAKGWVLAFLHLLFLKNIEKCITVSMSNKLKLNKVTNTDFTVIYNGVNIDKYNDVKSGLQSPNIIDFDLKKFTFIFTGPLIKRKNVSQLIEVFSVRPEFQLIILGDGPLKSELIDNDFRNIFFLGQVNNVVDYLKVSNAFILLSSSEGMPNAALEALSFGLPCILSDIDAHKDLHSLVGDIVKLVHNIDDLSQFIDNDLLSFISLSDSSINRNEYLNKISSFRMSKEYLSVYNSMR